MPTIANLMQTLSVMANPDGWIYWYHSRWFEYMSLQQVEGWDWVILRFFRAY